MSRLTRDGTAEPVSRGQILRRERGQGNINFHCSADHEQDWQPYPVDPYSAICDDHTYITTLRYLLLILLYNIIIVHCIDSIGESTIFLTKGLGETYEIAIIKKKNVSA